MVPSLFGRLLGGRGPSLLLAMGIETYGNIRIGLTDSTAEADVEEFLTALPRVLQAIGAPLGD